MLVIPNKKIMYLILKYAGIKINKKGHTKNVRKGNYYCIVVRDFVVFLS